MHSTYMLCQIFIDDAHENYIPYICNETTEDSVDTYAYTAPMHRVEGV